MKYNLYAIGEGLNRNYLSSTHQIVYTLVRLSRYGEHDLIDHASEAEAIQIARHLKSGYIRYDTELDQYWINHSGSTLKNPAFLQAMGYVSWTNSYVEHIHFATPELFEDTQHFEIVEQDCSRRYLFKETLTTEIPF